MVSAYNANMTKTEAQALTPHQKCYISSNSRKTSNSGGTMAVMAGAASISINRNKVSNSFCNGNGRKSLTSAVAVFAGKSIDKQK